MNITQHFPNFSWHRYALFVVLPLLAVTTSLAKPRPTSPPWPEIGSLFYEGFDQPYSFPTNQIIDTNIWAESWSGYALNRAQGSVQPFTVPMVNLGTNRTLNFDPERGAIRIWYQPAWSAASAGQGRGPGELARLLTLVCTNGRSSSEWWSLVVSPDGNELHLVCETDNGPASCLSTPINWEAGSWHLLGVGYTPTNSALIVDGQIVATGNGIASLPSAAMPYTTLVIGSDLAGRDTAKGQFEQLTTFTGRNRFRSMTGHPFGMGTVWDVQSYYAAFSPEAAKGPITPEEEVATRARWAALRAERQAQQEAALLSGTLQMDGPLGGGFHLDSYDPEQRFWLLSPDVD